MWFVDPPGTKPQTGAQAITIDDQGNLVLAAFACDDNCVPEVDLRFLDDQLAITNQIALGTYPTKQLGTQALAWHPAGYVVIATGGPKGNESAFTVRAFSSTGDTPLWTFARKDAGTFRRLSRSRHESFD